MKKFSKITNQKVYDDPKVDKVIDESELLRYKILIMIEKLLTIKTYGPIDRYLQAGSIKISGKELLTEAILSLLDDKKIKEQTKLLESLKGEIKDWEVIDKKIENINLLSKSEYKTDYKVNKLLEMYDDDEVLIQVVKNKASKSSKETSKKYLEAFSKSKIKEETLNKIKEVYISKINE
jgi:hypothetical protein